MSKRDAEVESGAVHYTALDCWKEENGAQRSYEIAEGITMNILYNVFYEEKTSDENDYSVCMLLSQGENHYLFTGDLEKDGEAALVKNNARRMQVVQGRTPRQLYREYGRAFVRDPSRNRLRMLLLRQRRIHGKRG